MNKAISRAASGAALLLCAVTVAGCTSSSGSRLGSVGSAASTPGTEATGTSSPAPTPTSSAASTSATPSTTPAAPSTTRSVTTHVPVPRAKACTGSAVAVSFTNAPVRDRVTFGYVVHLRNNGSAACTLTGFPGVAAVDSSGRLLQNAHQSTQGTSGVRTVFLLQHGGTATALLSWSAVRPGQVGQCDAPAYDIKVTPPNTFATRTYHKAVGRCSFDIHPVQPA